MSLSEKKTIIFLLFNFLFVFQLGSTQPPNIKEQNLWKTPAQTLIESIPLEDRGHFVVYHLSVALNNYYQRVRSNDFQFPVEANIPAEKYQTFKSMTTYPKLSSEMLNWTKKTFNATDQDVRSLVTTFSAVCPYFDCFDPNDIGQMCCPF